jgi:wyosine [tRNA(Phe)-imidazoG37] synthetase (radical SAM superfamily)
MSTPTKNRDEQMSCQCSVFGPVPSRRLGRSLGVNHIPPKTCSYSCVYCQVGRTNRLRIQREVYCEVEDLVKRIASRIQDVREDQNRVDYVTLVPDGEPTLEKNLGTLIRTIKSDLDTPIAVISNASLLPEPEVQVALSQADWVSLKVDAVVEDIWRRIDRPHGSLELEEILSSIEMFAGKFEGKLVTETMLVGGLNDDKDVLKANAEFIGHIRPEVAYLSVPTRPPAESWVAPPSEDAVNSAYEIYRREIGAVELLIEYEGDDFYGADSPITEILNVASVHPLREQAVASLVGSEEYASKILDELVDRGLMKLVEYQGEKYFIRKIGQV